MICRSDIGLGLAFVYCLRFIYFIYLFIDLIIDLFIHSIIHIVLYYFIHLFIGIFFLKRVVKSEDQTRSAATAIQNGRSFPPRQLVPLTKYSLLGMASPPKGM